MTFISLTNSIVSGVPRGIAQYFAQHQGNIQPLNIAAVVAIVLATVATIVFFERAQRQIPIYYARRTVGRRIYGGQTAHLPLRVNTSGTIPPIFASSLLMFPSTLANFKVPGMSQLQSLLSRGDWAFNTFYVLLIIFFCHFYKSKTFGLTSDSIGYNFDRCYCSELTKQLMKFIFCCFVGQTAYIQFLI